MKRNQVVLVLFIGLLLVGLVFAQAFTIESPRGRNVKWKLGSTQSIGWSSGGPLGTVKLVLRRNGVNVGVVAKDIPSAGSPHYFPWKVGEYIGGTAPAGTNYQIRVRVVGGDFKDSVPFEILENLKVLKVPKKPQVLQLPLNVLIVDQKIRYNLTTHADGSRTWNFYCIVRTTRDLDRLYVKMTLTSASHNDNQIIHLDDLKAGLDRKAGFDVKAMLDDPVTVHMELDHYKSLTEKTRDDNYASIINQNLY